MHSQKLNFLFYSLGIFISGLFSFLFIPTVVQLYGINIYGTFTIIFNILSIVCMFCYGWVGQSYIRFYTKIEQPIFAICQKLVIKSLLIGFSAFALLGLLIAKVTIRQLLFFCPTYFFFGYYCFLLLVLQAKKKAKIVMFSEVIRTSINLIFTIALFKLTNNFDLLEVLSVASFFSYLISTIFLVKKGKIKNEKIEEPNNLKISKQLLTFGIPIAIFLSGSLALSVNDRFLISHFIDHENSSIYSAIYDFINKGVTVIFAPILMTFYPLISEYYNKGEYKVAYKKIKEAILLEILLIFLGLIVLIFSSNLILQLLFSEQMPYELNKVCYLIYFGVCLWQLAMLLHKPLELMENTKYMAIAVFSAFFFNLAANYVILQYSKSLIYPAVTTIAGSLVYIILIKIFNRKHDKFNSSYI